MWKHCCALVCAIAALTLSSATLTKAVSDPSTLPLVQFADLLYTGAFRVPSTTINGDSFDFGGHPMAYNPARNSLFLGSRAGRVAEITVATPVQSAQPTSLPTAAYLQGFRDPTEGHLSEVTGDVAISGLLVHNNRLHGTASIYYDANNQQRVSHYSRSLQLDQASFSGWSQVWELKKSGFVSGFMAVVPAEWQGRLGGPAITGQCCIPIAWRTSWGPAAFAFDPSHVGQSIVTASPLLYYDQGHPELGAWGASSPVYGATTLMSGAVLIAGTRTVLYFGRNGIGPYCYGNGTGTQSLHGTLGTDGAHWCYDPTNSDKGQHAYPYRYQIWAYDLNDFAAVKAGQKEPWDVMPYGVWPFSLPTPDAKVKLGGVGYDAVRQVIYVSQLNAERDGYDTRPVIHALKVGGATGTPIATPTLPTAPPPTTSARATAVELNANKTAPQPSGTSIMFSATPTGGVGPHQYKWWIFDGATWVATTSWTTASFHTWTPTVAKAGYRAAVWVRSASNGADAAETSTAIDFPISGTAVTAPPPATTVPPPTSTALKVSSVSMAANKTSPQPPGTAIGMTATPVAGVAPHQYKWWIYDGATWTASGTWSTSNAFTWTPTVAKAGYRVAVWVRSAGNTRDEPEAKTEITFTISGAAPSASTPPPTTSARATAVTLGVNKLAPQLTGTAITWSAFPTGGVGPHQYKFTVWDGSMWLVGRSWNTANTFTWVPTMANAYYKVRVWVRSAGNTTDDFEASAVSNMFPITR